ncbi:MAG: toxin-antitoxin system TumE family protein [Nitrospirota bacterium]
MSVELLFYRKNVETNGDIVEMKIWQVPHSKEKPHGLKYSLVYVREGKRIIGYDNAEGKGDHKHYRNKEYPYRFNDVDTLIKDFYDAVEKAKRGGL